MRDNELWEKYGRKSVVADICGQKREVAGIIIGVLSGGLLIFESTDGWCDGHNGFDNTVIYGDSPKDSSSSRWWIDHEDVEIIEDFIKI